MRNILIVLAVVATVIIAGKAIAETPATTKARSVLIKSPSDSQPQTMRQSTMHPRMMVSQQMEQPVVQAKRVITPQRQTRYRSQPSKKQSFFSKLMETERRKNAWLKEKFFGR